MTCSGVRPRKEGTAADVRLRRDGPAVDVILPVSLLDGRSIEAEVDMGSGALILDVRLAAGLGIRLDGPEVRRVDGMPFARPR